MKRNKGVSFIGYTIGAILSLHFIGFGVAQCLGVYDNISGLAPDKSAGWVESFRDQPVTLDTAKTLMLGDELVRDEHIRATKTFSGLLNAFNAGQNAYDTYHSLGLLENLVGKADFERVVVVVSPSDIIPQADSQLNVIRRLAGLHFYQPSGSWPKRIMDYIVNNRKFEEWSEKQAALDARKGEIVHIPKVVFKDWVVNLDSLAALKSNLETYVVMVPDKAHILAAANNKKESPFFSLVARACQERGIPFLDLTREIVDAPYKKLFRQSRNFSPKGHRFAAAAIDRLMNAQMPQVAKRLYKTKRRRL